MKDTTPPPSPRALVGLFIVALLLRWGYAVAFYALLGDDGLKGPDSQGFLILGRGMAEALAAGKLAGWAWLGPDLSHMPLLTWVLALSAALAGSFAALGFTLFQGAFDAGTCLFVAGIARMVAPRAALIAGYAAAFTPTFIVLSGLVYGDTLFVFFATASLYAALRWLARPSLGCAIAIGVMIGVAAMIRVGIAPWALALVIFLIAAGLIRRMRRAQLGQLVAVAAIVAAFLSPVLARNVALHGAWSLTPQGGNHLAYWVFPLVKEFADGTPREATKKDNDTRIAARFGPMPSENPFADSARYSAFAQEELSKLGFGAIARAWIFGAAINLASPAVVHVPPVSALPRRGFYDTPGANFWAKLQAFLFGSGSTLYAWLLMLGLLGLAAFRLVQIVGIFALMRRGANAAGLLLLAGWCLYVLALNGPIASPKYRLPLEPVLAILTGVGLAAFVRRRPAESAPDRESPSPPSREPGPRS
jgi:4-amino-4-deoxy-L-arabinose transferase-like glycosyltransferase